MNTQPKLLVIDDERVVCDSCDRIFSPKGYHVDTCLQSVDGLRLASSNQYQAILVDYMMPGMDGIEMIERLREKNKKVPVMMITGYPSDSTAREAKRLGVREFIRKPFTPDELTSAVERMFFDPAVEEPIAVDAAQAADEIAKDFEQQPLNPDGATEPPSLPYTSWFKRLHFTTRGQQKITVVSHGMALRSDAGFGKRLRAELHKAGYPVEIDYGRQPIPVMDIVKEAEANHRMIVVSVHGANQEQSEGVRRIDNLLADYFPKESKNIEMYALDTESAELSASDAIAAMLN